MRSFTAVGTSRWDGNADRVRGGSGVGKVVLAGIRRWEGEGLLICGVCADGHFVEM